jgi:hypothetical protein
MKILYNQNIQVEPEFKNRKKTIKHIVANTIQFSDDTPTYVLQNNITLDELKNIYRNYKSYKLLNKIIEQERIKHINHACNYCQYCTNYDDYINKKLTNSISES